MVVPHKRVGHTRKVKSMAKHTASVAVVVGTMAWRGKAHAFAAHPTRPGVCRVCGMAHSGRLSAAPALKPRERHSGRHAVRRGRVAALRAVCLLGVVVSAIVGVSAAAHHPTTSVRPSTSGVADTGLTMMCYSDGDATIAIDGTTYTVVCPSAGRMHILSSDGVFVLSAVSE